MTALRVASLVPSATDILCALGLAEALVGVSHECDHPAAEGLPVLTQSRIPAAPAADPAEVDRAVSETVAAGDSLYVADRARLAELRPDVVVSQDICDVCAVEGNVARAALPEGARLVMLNATSIAGLDDDVSRLAEATDQAARGRQVLATLHERLEATRGIDGPRLLALEWSAPPFLGGHWVPELVAHVGARDVLATPGAASRRATWSEIAAAEPELVVFMPCGYHLEEAAAEAERCSELRALGKPVWATDATRLFSRCTLDAIAAGAETLAAIAQGRAPDARSARRV